MEQSNPQICWRTKYAAAYMETDHMVIRYRFPYSKKREAALLGAYGLSPADRLPYYQNLGTAIERNLLMADYFQTEGVPSVLTFESASQQMEENNVMCIYAVPSEPVTPLSQCIFASDCNALTVFNVFLRLTHIFRDLYRTPLSPVIRYLDMDDIFLTQENKILFGCFHYIAGEGVPDPPPFLPDAAPVMTEEIRNGATGDMGSDMQMLARVAWNVFSGLSWNAAHTSLSEKIYPKYAPPALVKALEIGLRGNPNEFNAFRKQLLQCHKELAKSEFAQRSIPMQPPHKKSYHFNGANIASRPMR